MKRFLLFILCSMTALAAVPPVIRQAWTTNTVAYATNGVTNVGGIVHTALAAGAGITLATNTGQITITAAGAGLGDVTGPVGANDNAFAVYDGATGKQIKEGDGFLTGTNAYLPYLWTWDIAVTNAVTIGGTNVLAAIAAVGGGSGDDVFVNHADVANPNFTNSTDIAWTVSNSTNVSAALLAVYQPTNATLTHLSTNTITGTGRIALESEIQSIAGLLDETSASALYQGTNATLTALSTNTIIGTGQIALESEIPSIAGLLNEAAASVLYQATNATLTAASTNTFTGTGRIVLESETPSTAGLLDEAAASALYQATNAAITALVSNPALYQATNAALTALATTPAMYQATNGVLTTIGGIGAGTEGDIIYRDAARWTNLVRGSDGQYLKLASGIPSWAAVAGGSGKIELRASFDGSGSVIEVASKLMPIGNAVTLAKCTLVGDAAGSVTVHFSKYTPSAGALGAETMIGTNALASMQYTNDVTLAGWTAALSADDVLKIAVVGTPTTIKQLNVFVGD